MKLSDAQVVRAMQLLGLTQADFLAIQKAPTFAAGQQALEVLKERTRKQFKRVAMDLHPDRTNNDPVKTEDFKLVSSAVDDIDRLQLRAPPRPMPVIRIVFRSSGFGGFSATGFTTTATGAYWSGFGF